MLLRRHNLYVLVVILFILILGGTAMAAQKFKIKPRFSASWKVDDNFFKSEVNERKVYTYLLQPGIDLGFETAKNLLSFSYTLNNYSYDDQDSLSPGQELADREDYTGHKLLFRDTYKPTYRLSLGLEDLYDKTREPANSDRLSNSISRDKYTVNQISPWVSYEIGPKLSSEFRYRYKERDYDKATNEDAEENRAIITLTYNLKPETTLNLEYQTWGMDYDLASSDYDSDQIKLIFMKQFKYFSFEAGAGYHNRSFDVSSIDDMDVFTYRLSLIGQNPPKPNMEPRSSIELAAEQNLNDLGEGEEYFKAQRYTLKAMHVFMEKIIASVQGYYQNSDYEITTGITPSGAIELREDKIYNLSCSLGYKFLDWLTFSLTAGHEDRNSNLAGFDYDNRYYMAKMDFSYNLGKK